MAWLPTEQGEDSRCRPSCCKLKMLELSGKIRVTQRNGVRADRPPGRATASILQFSSCEP